jgi:hypothetical protein
MSGEVLFQSCRGCWYARDDANVLQIAAIAFYRCFSPVMPPVFVVWASSLCPWFDIGAVMAYSLISI